MPGEIETPPSETPPESLLTTPPATTEPETTPKVEGEGETPPPKQEEAPAAEFVPLAVTDITFPEGAVVDEASRDEFLGILNNREMTPKEQGQALVDLQLRMAQAASETSSKAWEATQTEWQDAVKADKDVGGDNLQPALDRIGRLIDEHGSPELRQVLDLTGAGNNVHVIKFFDNLAKLHTESTAPAQGQAPNGSGSAASRMFPSMKG